MLRCDSCRGLLLVEMLLRGGETWAREARGGGNHSMRSAKKNPHFIGVVLFVAVWRCEWQRFQTEEFLRSLNLARRSNIIFSLHFYKST